ncbi:MAG: GNAT family N-acetyltransferase [Paludibacteraceae bacterium]
MTNKERYVVWATEQDGLPIFLQPWWMDAVCTGKEWDVLLAENERGEIMGAMPYLIRKRLGMRYIVMPQMTQLGGIWLAPQYAEDQWQVTEICRMIAEQLDNLHLAYYYQQYAPKSLCVEPMQALGFKARERITYRINDLNDLDALISRFSKNKKRQLQKALSLHADYDMSPEDFYRFHAACLVEQRKTITYSRDFFLVLERKLHRLNQCAIIAIKDADNHTHAAAFLAWDNKLMYYLIPCYSLEFKNSGAGALLVLESIKLAREKQVRFDFEGSMVSSIANHYKQFGSEPCTYYSLEKHYHQVFRLALFFNHFRNLRYKLHK